MSCVGRKVNSFILYGFYSVSSTIPGSFNPFSLTLRHHSVRYLALPLQSTTAAATREVRPSRGILSAIIWHTDYGCIQVSFTSYVPLLAHPLLSYFFCFCLLARIFYLRCRSPRGSAAFHFLVLISPFWNLFVLVSYR